MDGRESWLTRKVESDENLTKIVLEQIAKTGSSVGARLVIDGRKYIITDGNLYSVEKKVQKICQELKEKYFIK